MTLKLKKNISILYYLCVSVLGCPWSPEEGIRFPGARVTGNCELPDVVVEN